MTRTASYVVADEATDRGRDAVQPGVALVRLTAAELRICLIRPTSSAVPAKWPTGESDYGSLLEEQGRDWRGEAVDLVPSDVTATAHLLWAVSSAGSIGLLGAVDRPPRRESDRYRLYRAGLNPDGLPRPDRRRRANPDAGHLPGRLRAVLLVALSYC